MLTDIKECKSVSKSIFLNEQTDFIRWLRLKIAVLYVKNLVKAASYVEAKTIFFLWTECLGILIIEDPAAL